MGQVEPSEVTTLFNGTNLGGFYTWLADTKREDPRQVFGVTNGLIRISGEGLGYLSTQQEFRKIYFRKLELHPLRKSKESSVENTPDR